MADESSTIDDRGYIPRFADAPVGAVLGGVAAFLSSIGTIWIGLLMLLIVADVLGRNFFNAPITGVAEIAARSVVAIVFLQVSAAILQGRLTRADFLLRRIGRASPGAVNVLEIVFALCGATVLAVLLWASWPKTVEAWVTAEFFGVQGVFTIPTFPFRAITVVGCTVGALACLYRAGQSLRALRGAAE
ncbi:TRAP transporter small permease [Halovulum dunhuangense]|uniref:TRAP transporter small permease protein n=1 Tax=Halovulum dunhuangense TaxID=1505036 RepID=A0A849L1Z5_9RHOB|nr:TRAP transporter small permease [Halovulum dunhuangense]NNU80338.1 TRAP transporter small permease [Halovulum dunhuangense]